MITEYAIRVKFTDMDLVSTGGRSSKFYRFTNPHDAIEFISENNLTDKVHVLNVQDTDDCYWDARAVPLKLLQNSIFDSKYRVWKKNV